MADNSQVQLCLICKKNPKCQVNEYKFILIEECTFTSVPCTYGKWCHDCMEEYKYQIYCILCKLPRPWKNDHNKEDDHCDCVYAYGCSPCMKKTKK